jgi:hypothetical protein
MLRVQTWKYSSTLATSSLKYWYNCLLHAQLTLGHHSASSLHLMLHVSRPSIKGPSIKGTGSTNFRKTVLLLYMYIFTITFLSYFVYRARGGDLKVPNLCRHMFYGWPPVQCPDFKNIPNLYFFKMKNHWSCQGTFPAATVDDVNSLNHYIFTVLRFLTKGVDQDIYVLVQTAYITWLLFYQQQG